MLTKKYVDRYYWWEVVVLLKKLAFVMVVDLSNSQDSHLRAFMAEIVLLCGAFAEQMTQPRKQESRIIHMR
jgi:hypothetical protein